MILPRRKFLAGLGALLGAPAIVRAASLMPVHSPRDFSTAGMVLQMTEHDAIGWMDPRGVYATAVALPDGTPVVYGDLELVRAVNGDLRWIRA